MFNLSHRPRTPALAHCGMFGPWAHHMCDISMCVMWLMNVLCMSVLVCPCACNPRGRPAVQAQSVLCFLFLFVVVNNWNLARPLEMR